MKVDEKQEAVRLRLEEQLSLRQIAERTGLSKATLSVLLRPYPLSDERIAELSIGSQMIGAMANKRAGDERKAAAKAEGAELVKVHDGFKSLCLLYWGEGTKHPRNNYFSFSNADPAMIRFVAGVLTGLGYADKLVFTSYCLEGEADEAVIEFWRPYIDVSCRVYRSKKSSASLNKKNNTIRFGTMRLDVYESKLYHMVLGGIESFK